VVAGGGDVVLGLCAVEDVLDNAGWHSLVGPHAAFAVEHGAARAYRDDVSVFHATPDDSPDAWADLVPLATADGVVVLFRGDPITVPEGWHESFRGDGHQMVLTGPLPAVPPPPAVDPVTGAAVTMRDLGAGDAPAMVELVALTEPGPFRARTHELGGYVGIFHDERLVAMAGRRLHPPGFVEVSAVCTHPDARRRGYASVVSALVAERILADGDTPFLHVAVSNTGAYAVYEQLGFTTRRTVAFGAYRVPRP
jgi:ribosomal protein S18 acetylase RimI-like enzyme